MQQALCDSLWCFLCTHRQLCSQERWCSIIKADATYHLHRSSSNFQLPGEHLAYVHHTELDGISTRLWRYQISNVWVANSCVVGQTVILLLYALALNKVFEHAVWLSGLSLSTCFIQFEQSRGFRFPSFVRLQISCCGSMVMQSIKGQILVFLMCHNASTTLSSPSGLLACLSVATP